MRKSDIVWGSQAGFIELFKTQDEFWIHHFEPEIKRQSMLCEHPCLQAPTKAKIISSLYSGEDLRFLGIKMHYL